ncbi:MAG: hypothetical protein ACRDPY_22140 [Streptosporangiaceae bacterium]
MTATTGTWSEPQAGNRTIRPAFCDRCCFQMEAGEGVYTSDGGRLGARHVGDCPPPLTVREIAAAVAIGPRSKQVRVDDRMAMIELLDMPRSEAVLAVLASHPFNRMPAGPRKNRCGVVARALLKAMSTARLNPVATSRIRGYTPWQVCKLVEHISRGCPESQLGMMCDVWICRNHENL